MGRRRREIGTNGASGAGIRHQIPPAAAEKRVRPAATDQNVIARAAIQQIRPAAPHELILARPPIKPSHQMIADQGVIMGRSADPLDLAQDISRRKTAV